MTEALSPAAQAVLHEFWQAPVSPSRNVQIAAALRAAVDQVIPLYACSLGSTRGTTRLGVRQKLIAIAAELEGADG